LLRYPRLPVGYRAVDLLVGVCLRLVVTLRTVTFTVGSVCAFVVCSTFALRLRVYVYVTRSRLRFVVRLVGFAFAVVHAFYVARYTFVVVTVGLRCVAVYTPTLYVPCLFVTLRSLRLIGWLVCAFVPVVRFTHCCFTPFVTFTLLVVVAFGYRFNVTVLHRSPRCSPRFVYVSCRLFLCDTYVAGCLRLRLRLYVTLRLRVYVDYLLPRARSVVYVQLRLRWVVLCCCRLRYVVRYLLVTIPTLSHVWLLFIYYVAVVGCLRCWLDFTVGWFLRLLRLRFV